MSGGRVVLLWAAILFVLWVLAWAVFQPDTTTVVLGAWLWGATVVWGVVALWLERRRTPDDGEAPTAVDVSHSTALLGIAIFSLLLATQFGAWLAYVAGGMLVLALGGLVRERRAAREERS